MTRNQAGKELTDRVREIRDRLTTGLVERNVAVRLALLAALSGEHLLLVGPPGTAKSFVARRLRLAFADASYFERLLTRFSVPEELFGPLSIKGLEEDRYERLTASYLPTASIASIAFLDEIFKANSAILNALLTLLNEREFDNGDRREKTPLTAVVGASNELPEGEELDALFDRFLLRLHVGPVSKDAFPELLKLRDGAEPVLPRALRLAGDDLASVREAAGNVRIPGDVLALLCDLRDWCTAAEIPVSDRRWRKVVKLLQMNRAFDAASLERRYAFLDECPEHVLDAVITLPFGSLSERVHGALAWRNALLDGRLPPADAWPPAEIARPVRRALDRMGLVRFCRDQPEVVDALLADVLAAFSRQDQAFRAEVARRLRELEDLERARLREQEDLERAVGRLADHWKTHSRRARHRPEPVQLDEEALRRLRERAEREATGHMRDADTDLIEAWGERARLWAEVAGVFGDLGEMLGRGWDLTLGVLRHTGWNDLLRLRELVERLPEIREVVRSLGRLHVSETAESVAERIFVPMRRLEEERREARTPLVPAETRGVERSGSVARMLPAEAAMLGHPGLRLLWHARRAERALLTYKVEGVEIERTRVEREVTEESEVRRPRQERGPILAVVDTSGSMHGLPEQVAKALVLEALRTAHAEKRRCRLYAFGGPDQTLEHELDLSPDGIGRLLDFLGLSFGGGSDPTEATSKVLRQLQEGEWTKADVLLVSDGEWPAPAGLIPAVQRAREAGTRLHGVQIGNRGETGLHAICDPVHVFTDWASIG